MGATELVVSPPQVPSKWDIIPIHASDMGNYKRCRRYWDWTSPARNNLRKRVDIGGVKMELWYGSGIHYGLEMYYDPILQRDPIEAFLEWYELQWNGGIVTEDWLDRTYDVQPVLIPAEHRAKQQGDTRMYQIAGLRDLLPAPEVVEEEFLFHRDLGINMLTFYKDWAKRNDDFITVAAESVFSIPLGFEARDLREDSPNYNKMVEVHLRGKRDAVIYWPERDVYGINDHKTAARIDEDYFLKLEKDEQCTTYLLASILEAKMYDLPWYGKKVDRILYTALRKNYPKPPTPTYKGTRLSINRQEEGTTAELFAEAVAADPVLQQWFTTSKDAQDYYTYLCEQGEDLFVIRKPVTRNDAEIISQFNHIVAIAKEMLNPDLAIYPSPSGNWMCTRCAFRSPCLAADDGSDWKGMLFDGYETNRDR